MDKNLLAKQEKAASRWEGMRDDLRAIGYPCPDEPSLDALMMIGRMAGMTPTEIQATDAGGILVQAHANVMRIEFEVLTRRRLAGEQEPGATTGGVPAAKSPIDVPPATSGARGKEWWESRAMILVMNNPDWSDRKIAREVNIDPAQLSRSENYQRCQQLARQPRGTVRRGHIEQDERGRKAGIEAYEEE